MKTLIVGGGIAGIAAAVKLISSGCEVELIEAAAKLGGRITDVNFPGTSLPEVDLGQHAIAGAYENFFDLMKILNSNDVDDAFIESEIFFALGNGDVSRFQIPEKSNPLDLLRSLTGLKHISVFEKIILSKFFLFIKTSRPEKFVGYNLGEILDKYSVPRLDVKFWDKILVSIFNTPYRNISTPLFLRTAKKLFFERENNGKIYLPRYSFRKIIINPASLFLKKKGASVFVNEKVISLKIGKNKIEEIVTTKRKVNDFDFVISALPPDKLAGILEEKTLSEKLSGFESGAILTAYFRLKENVLQRGAFILSGSKLDWLFNFGEYFSVVASSTRIWEGKSKLELKNEIIFELNKFFSVFSFENVLDFVLLIKKNSTIMSDNLNCGLREQISSPFSNLLIAGDWINTGLPVTLESAVVSGFDAAGKVCSLGSDLGTAT